MLKISVTFHTKPAFTFNQATGHQTVRLGADQRPQGRCESNKTNKTGLTLALFSLGKKKQDIQPTTKSLILAQDER